MIRYNFCVLQPLEKVVFYCKELEEIKLHSAPLTFTLSFALEANKTGNTYL